MDIREFFELPEEVREDMFKLHRKQKEIRATRESINEERKQLDTREINNQIRCEHTFAESKYEAFEDEYGRFTGDGEYRHYCPDCGKRWTTKKP